MAFDEQLADRVRDQLAALPAVSERRMFGGWGAMVDGHLCVGVIGEDLIARIGKQAHDAAIGRPGVREFDFTGRPMPNWVVVSASVLQRDDELAAWVDDAHDFVRSLPPKESAGA